jgi:hypothetical protein
LIRVMFECVAKSSKVGDDGTTFTITLARENQGQVLFTKIKTTSRNAASQFVEGKEYPISIYEDDEPVSGGVFANAEAAPAQEKQAVEPNQPEPEPETWNARIARLTRKVIDDLKEANVESVTVQTVAEQVARLLDEEDKVPERSPDSFAAFVDDIRERVYSAMDDIATERRRAKIREIADAKIAAEAPNTWTPSALADEVSLEFYADEPERPDEDDLDEVQEIVYEALGIALEEVPAPAEAPLAADPGAEDLAEPQTEEPADAITGETGEATSAEPTDEPGF